MPKKTGDHKQLSASSWQKAISSLYTTSHLVIVWLIVLWFVLLLILIFSRNILYTVTFTLAGLSIGLIVWSIAKLTNIPAIFKKTYGNVQELVKNATVLENTITENISEGLIIADQNNRIVQVNSKAQMMLSLEERNIIGKPLTEIVSIIYQARKIKTRFLPPATIIPVTQGGKELATLAIIPDINRELALERARTEFLSVVGHQLRSPLGSTRWAIEILLAGDVGEISPEVRSTLERIYASNQWMITLVNDLLSVSRIDQNRVIDEPILVDIVDIVKAVIKEQELEARKKSISFELTTNPTRVNKIFLDPKRFREVIQNLISNAVKYSQVGASVNISIDLTTKMVRISVSDTGMGIPQADQRKIFSKFFRAQNALQNKIEGTGLGLFVVKSYVESWGGKVTFESSEGKGTTFYIEFPLKFDRVSKKVAITT